MIKFFNFLYFFHLIMISVFVFKWLLVFGMVLLMGWRFDKYGLGVGSECITSDLLSKRVSATEATI